MAPAESSSPVRANRLFVGSCVALVATSVAFATVGAVMLALKQEFVLSNLQVGWIGGAALWGFAVSQLLFAPLCDSLGMRTLIRLAFVGHLAGTLTMMFAPGFAMLFGGALVIAMANGLVEAACNPLVAALFPENKTVRLNQFHVWFPGGIVIGGLAAFGLDQVGMTGWPLKLSLILLPTVLYGFLLLGERFPATEGVQSGVSMREMFAATFGTPLMWIMLVAMAMTASIELGPNRWVPAVLEAGGMPGILVLVWINGLMAIMRFRAGTFVHSLSPTGILLASAGISGVGLWWLSYAGSLTMALGAATVFAVGVCYFWPTMLGFVSERIPRSGALGLGLMGTVGMAVVGLVTAPWMGRVADRYAHEELPVAETVGVLEAAVASGQVSVVATDAAVLAGVADPVVQEDVRATLTSVERVLTAYRADGTLPPVETENALRAVISTLRDEDVVSRAAGVLGPADNYGGRISFRHVVPLSGGLLLIFGFLYLRDRRAGGYRIETLRAT